MVFFKKRKISVKEKSICKSLEFWEENVGENFMGSVWLEQRTEETQQDYGGLVNKNLAFLKGPRWTFLGEKKVRTYIHWLYMHAHMYVSVCATICGTIYVHTHTHTDTHHLHHGLCLRARLCVCMVSYTHHQLLWRDLSGVKSSGFFFKLKNH